MSRRRARTRSLPWLALVLCSACHEPSDGFAERPRDAAARAEAAAPDGGAGSDAHVLPVTYQGDIRPLIERSCLPCHATGGVAPFPLDSWEAVRTVAPVAVAAVAERRMPPFPADEECRELTEAHTLTPHERTLFERFRADGFREGNEEDYVAPGRVAPRLQAPDIRMRPAESYVARANADEYVCFLLDELAVDTYVRALEIAPEQRDQVHHAQIHVLTPMQRAYVQDLEAYQDTPGYECAVGTRVASQLLYSYRPGSEATIFAPGDAALIEAGSTLLLQVHYNNIASASAVLPAPDRTELRLWTLRQGELPQRIVARTGVTAAVDIAAGAPLSVSRTDSPMGMISTFGSVVGFGGTFLQGEIVGIAPHAHQLATRLSASISHAQGASVCLVDVPRWDFHFQLDYLYREGVPYGADDRLVVRCEYDNSREHQATVDGVLQAPRDVGWGERTSDEMCLFYLWLRFERDAYLAARSAGPLP